MLVLVIYDYGNQKPSVKSANRQRLCPGRR